ncbi:hypothetical protein [Caballeronia sp. INML1]|uniref:hypothetical protein n=1 Tax=Caballeronia sp. INML1 TaxID=2921760 RepID=UPI0020293B34|nr:hypothetical protein [Caballeronia sp. INML1]
MISPNSSVRFRFHPDHFKALQAEAAAKGITLRAVIHRRIRSLIRDWPNGSYVRTEARSKKRLEMDVSETLPALTRIAEQIGCGLGGLGDVIATHETGGAA